MISATAAAFLAELRVAVLSVQSPDRAPLAAPVWYALDGQGQPWFVSPKATPKSKLIEAAGRLTLTAQIETRPYAYVSVSGSAALVTAVPADIHEMACRYLGDEAGSAFADQMHDAMANGTRWRITLSPEHVTEYGLAG